MPALLAQPAAEQPDAAVAASDWTAVGALLVLRQHGQRVPDDVALTGFGNDSFTALLQPRLSSVEQHGEEMPPAKPDQPGGPRTR